MLARDSAPATYPFAIRVDPILLQPSKFPPLKDALMLFLSSHLRGFIGIFHMKHESVAGSGARQTSLAGHILGRLL
jgi:hypothetical protein